MRYAVICEKEEFYKGGYSNQGRLSLILFDYFSIKFEIMKTFNKTFRINAEPSDIYAALTNPYTIELWSGYKAEMSTEPGSEFSLWEGDITGKNMEFVTDKKIVQEWYFGDQEDKSIVTITIKGGTDESVVTVEQTNIPDEDFNDIAEGWREYYMGAIKAFFNPNF